MKACIHIHAAHVLLLTNEEQCTVVEDWSLDCIRIHDVFFVRVY
jgi:hypothetical protein